MIRGTYQKLYPSVLKWTPDAFAETFVLGGMGPRIVGDPTAVADELQKWIEESDVDGFSESPLSLLSVEGRVGRRKADSSALLGEDLAYAVTPGTMSDIVIHLVPELQRRYALSPLLLFSEPPTDLSSLKLEAACTGSTTPLVPTASASPRGRECLGWDR